MEWKRLYGIEASRGCTTLLCGTSALNLFSDFLLHFIVLSDLNEYKGISKE